MANLIQVKRSTSNDAPASLVAGELAYSFLNTSNSLFIGNTGSVGGPIRIGGGKYPFLHQSNTGTPGALTANAVVITNGNSFVSDWKTNALTVGADGNTVSINSISTFANSSFLGNLGSNTELATAYAVKSYVDLKTSAASIVATNNQILYGNNNTYGQSSAFTFDSATNTLAIGNTTVNTSIAPSAITTAATIASGNTTITGFVNVSSYGTFGGQVNATALNISGVTAAGNTTVTGFVNVSTDGTFGGTVNAVALNISGVAAAGNTTVTGFITATGTVNASAMNVGANIVLSTTSISVGNSSVNTQITAGNVVLNGSTLVVGNTTTNATITGTSATFGGSVAIVNVVSSGNSTVTGFVNVSTDGTFGGAVNAASLNISGLTATGNTTVTGFVNVSSYGTFGGQVNAASLSVSGVAGTGNLTVTGTSSSGNTTVTGFVNVSTDGTFGGTVNATALNISGLVATGNTTTTGFINASSYGTFGGTVNATSFNSTGSGTSTFANNLTINGTTNTVILNVSGDASISGNLYVSGNLVSINVQTLAVSDSLIQLAVNNNVTPDILDIGLYGNYGVDANTNNHRHTGFFRDASDEKWKLFDDLLAAPTTTVDTSNATFRYATLQAHLSAGGAGASGFIANSTTVAVTANATLNVALVANTLSLSTALQGTSGGTGLASFTAEDLIVANSSNGFRKLNVGAEGYVLQVGSGVVSWNTLDGGSF